MILEMTDCETKFLQMKKIAMLRCKNKCTKKHYVVFNHKALQAKLSQLKSSVSVGLMQEGFDDMFDDNAPEQTVQLVQVGNSAYQEPIANKTEFVIPPVPRTEVPGNP